MASYSSKVFPCNLKLSHNTSLRDRWTDERTNRWQLCQ